MFPAISNAVDFRLGSLRMNCLKCFTCSPALLSLIKRGNLDVKASVWIYVQGKALFVLLFTAVLWFYWSSCAYHSNQHVKLWWTGSSGKIEILELIYWHMTNAFDHYSVKFIEAVKCINCVVWIVLWVHVYISSQTRWYNSSHSCYLW